MTPGDGLSVPGVPGIGGEGLFAPISTPVAPSLAGFSLVLIQSGVRRSAPLSNAKAQ